MQVGARGAQAPAAVDVAVERREALLAVAVDVVGQRPARLLRGLEQRVEQRAARRAALEHERTVPAAPLVGARQAGLHAFEVRQAVRVVPALHARLGGPALVVERVAALEDHPVDRARPAEDLAARVVDPAALHVRLGLGLVLPVVEATADREGQRGGHVDEDVPEPVRAAGLEHEHARRGVGAEAVGERGARRAAADDHEVRGRRGSHARRWRRARRRSTALAARRRPGSPAEGHGARGRGRTGAAGARARGTRCAARG